MLIVQSAPNIAISSSIISYAWWKSDGPIWWPLLELNKEAAGTCNSLLLPLLVDLGQEGRHGHVELVLHTEDQVPEGHLHRLGQHILWVQAVGTDIAILLEEVEQLRRIRHPKRKGAGIVSVFLEQKIQSYEV